MEFKNLFCLYLILISATYTKGANSDNGVINQMSRSAFDDDLYINVLDEELCVEQMRFLSNDSLRLQFLDASAKLPSGILGGNLNDLGDYYQCLSIDQYIENKSIQGKYCLIAVPLDQEISLPELPVFPEWPEIPWPNSSYETDDEVYETKRLYKAYGSLQQAAHIFTGMNPESNSRMSAAIITSQLGPSFGVCIPKVCSWKQASTILQDSLRINISSHEVYCRLPNDKPFVAADYLALVTFGGLLILAGASTTYDLYCQNVLKRKGSPIYSCFSIYTNTKRFLTFNTHPGALECIDGIRAISMMWVIVGHTYIFTLMSFVHNLRFIFEWLCKFSSVWINSAPITVDTFFLLSGILCVYSTIGKITRRRFAYSIPLFYLNRILRMLPLLAAVVLLQASLFNHVSDGPFWLSIASAAENCRKYWWSALLHVQNYVNTSNLCIPQTWYLSVDVQLYIMCPLILIFMFGSRAISWGVLGLIIFLSLVSSTLHSFPYNFSAAILLPNRLGEIRDYTNTYYMNTLARAPPFFVGMAYGYVLHLWKDRSIRIPKVYVVLLWACSFTLMAFCIFAMYPVMQLDHDAQMLDNLMNAYMRAIWALALGWLILACVKGYGGPINWFLSLRIWKLPARLSYAMYLLHVSVISIANASWVKTHYFTNGETLYRFGADFVFTFVFAFVLSILVDAPFSTLQKMLFRKGNNRSRPAKAESQEDIIENGIHDTKTKL